MEICVYILIHLVTHVHNQKMQSTGCTINLYLLLHIYIYVCVVCVSIIIYIDMYIYIYMRVCYTYVCCPMKCVYRDIEPHAVDLHILHNPSICICMCVYIKHYLVQVHT